MNVVLYARVSSDKQDVDLSISAQLKALREYAARLGYVVIEEFVDEAETGRTIHRLVFQEMIRKARLKPPPFQAILVWKLSRFARNREDSIIYKSLLRKQGIQVISINEPVDNTPSGRMMEGMGCKEIAKSLNRQGVPSAGGKQWGRGRVHAVLRNELYTGTLVWGVGGD